MNKKVSIVCITYNQEKYIAQAIESFLMQKTNFDVEIIISDDASSDSTPQIIEEYAKKNPNIKPILREKNIGAINNYIETLALATGEYVIVNEGDDYFSDENKIQKQVDFMEANPDYSICFHPVKRVFETGIQKDDVYPTEQVKNLVTAFDFENLLTRANFMQTNSVMYRRKAVPDVLQNFPKDILPGDWYLHLMFAKEGKIKFLEDIMSVYRINTGGIWYNSLTNINAHLAKYCFEIANFYKNVYYNIADKSLSYKFIVYSACSTIIRVLYQQKMFKKLVKFLFCNLNFFAEFYFLRAKLLINILK